MTKEERERLAEENIRLVGFVVNRMIRKGVSRDESELYSVALEGYAKAVRHYRPEISRFSTLAVLCIAQTVMMNERKRHRMKRQAPNVSLDESLPGEPYTARLDRIPGTENTEAQALARIALERALTAAGTDAGLLIAYAEGATQEELARVWGVSQPIISRRIARAQKRARAAAE